MPMIRLTRDLNVWTRRFAFYKKHLPQVCIEDGVKKLEQNYFFWEHYWEKYIVSATKGLTRLEWTDEQYFTDWGQSMETLLKIRFGDKYVLDVSSEKGSDRAELYDFAIKEQLTPAEAMVKFCGTSNEFYIGKYLARSLSPLGVVILEHSYEYFGKAIIAKRTPSTSCEYIVQQIVNEVSKKQHLIAEHGSVCTFTSPTLNVEWPMEFSYD